MLHDLVPGVAEAAYSSAEEECEDRWGSVGSSTRNGATTSDAGMVHAEDCAIVKGRNSPLTLVYG